MQLIDGNVDTTAYVGASRPIFVRGIMQRSGTNYLQDLLDLHPDVEAQTNVYEDHLFAESDLLIRYAELTSNAWIGPATEGGSACDDLLRSLGDALAGYLSAGITRPWFVTKMPSMDGLRAASLLFPRAPVLVVVRDGRAVVASAVATFKVPFDREVTRWADGARAVLRLTRTGSPNVMVVRYEDLVSNSRETMTSVLEHVGLDVSSYPFDSALALPVRGSSELAGRDGVHWKPVERASISPELRGANLSAVQLANFDRLAGAELEALGYSRDVALADSGFSVGRMMVPSKERLTWSSRRAGGRLRHMLRRFV